MRHHRQQAIAIALFQLSALGTAQESHFFRWNTPNANLAADNVYRRQSPPPGYHPEFGLCGSGTNCENACGPNWISCEASTSLSLFCYNKVDLNQTCCGNGSGRACESGYYCAWQEFGGKVWCCEDGQSLEECGVPQSGTSSMTSSATFSGGPGPSPSSGSETSGKTSGTATNTGSLSPTDSECPASTVTSWATTTFTVAATTVTVTEQGGGCSSSDSSSSRSGPSGSTSETITKPPSATSTSHGPITNSTTTGTIATAGARGLTVNHLTLALGLLSLFWL